MVGETREEGGSLELIVDINGTFYHEYNSLDNIKVAAVSFRLTYRLFLY